MKLIGSKAEQEIRDELRTSHEFHFSPQAKSRLKEVLIQSGYRIDQAYILDWTPDQAEDFYTVLVDGAFLVAVEIHRYEVDIATICKRLAMTEYLHGLSRIHQIRLLVAQELVNEKT